MNNTINQKTVLAIDFNNVLFMSYYGKPLINSKGTNVNAVKGFFYKLNTFKQIIDPDFIVCASDLSRAKTFRRKMYPSYKANRKRIDPDVVNQMEIAKRIFSLLGFQLFNNEEYEGDDVLGMISRLCEDNSMICVIVSADKDMYQLVTRSTSILNPRNNDYITPEYIQRMYGINYDQWIELKILQGDSGDNIPGMPKIGHKTALWLMQEFGSIDEIYKNLDKLKPGIAKSLTMGRTSIPMIRDLVTIVTDYSKLSLTVDQLYRNPPFTKELLDELIDDELWSLINVMRYDLLPQENDKIEIKERISDQNG